MPSIQPTKKSEVDSNFEKQIKAVVASAAEEHRQRTANDQVKWDKPADWEGDPFDSENIRKTFNRDKANQYYEQTVDDPENPGTSGDLVATTFQVDYLAVMERAFRARHGHTSQQFCRSVAHQSGRKKGHGASQGVFNRSVLEYLRNVLKQAGS